MKKCIFIIVISCVRKKVSLPSFLPSFHPYKTSTKERIKAIKKKEIHPFLTSSPMNKVYSIDHDRELDNYFWSYVKHHLEKATKVLPTFDKTTCLEFFKKSFKCVNPTKKFWFPSWIPSLPPTEKTFDSNPPIVHAYVLFNSYYRRNWKKKVIPPT